MKAKSTTVTFRAQTANVQVVNFGGMVRRLSVRETTGAASATVLMFDGTSTGGKLIDPIELSAKQSTRDRYFWDEYPVEVGLFANIVSGSVDIVCAIIPADLIDEWGEPVIVIGELDVNITS